MHDPDEILRKRCSASYQSHRRRAKERGQQLDYTPIDLHTKAKRAIYCPCKYCKNLLIPDNFACDHADPLHKGGSFGLHNVDFICQRCNSAKGILSAARFADLMELLRDWPQDEYVDTLARLRHGGLRFRKGAK